MKKILFVVLLFSLLTALSAADQLDEVYARLSAHPVTKGEFTQEQYIKVANRSLHSKGTFVMAADRGVIFDISEPFPSTMIVTEDKLEQIMPGDLTAVVDGRDNAVFKNIAKIIHSVFSNNTEVLREHFLVSVSGGPKDVVSLIPVDPLLSMLFLKITLTVGDSIDAISILETGGNWVNYNFYNKTFPERLTEDEQKKLVP